MSDDPSQDYFVDGMVEDITTGLSRIKWLFVIARNSSFTYKGKAVDIRRSGASLACASAGGQRAQGGRRLRITAQLIEPRRARIFGPTGSTAPLEDVFDLQDKIMAAIVGIIEPNLRRAEIERAGSKRPESLDAYDLYLRALPHLRRPCRKTPRSEWAILEQALKIDPNYAAAHALPGVGAGNALLPRRL